MKKSKSLFSRIPLFVVFVMLIAGFPNYMIQDAYAASATVSTIHTGDTAGDSAATTTIDVVFTQKVFVDTGNANGTSVDKQSLFDVGGAGAGVGIASAIVFDAVSLSDDASCVIAGTSATVVITLDVALATGAVPTVAFTNNGDVLTCDGADAAVTTFAATAATDGLSPVFVSAATTSATTIDITFSEDVVDTASDLSDWTIGGVAGGSDITSKSVSGAVLTITTNGYSILSSETVTITYAGSADEFDDTGTLNDLAGFGPSAVSNNISSGGSNNLGCWGDCTSPTIGLDKYQTRMVDGGFSYNGNTVNVIAHHTPFPLISAQIGQTNTVIVKVYDEYGTQGIRLVQFGLGLPEIGSPLDNAEAIIGIWLEYGGNNIEKVSITDKHNLIENSSVKTQINIVDCREGSADQCTQVTMKYMYREASIYNVMRVNVMDNYRNLQTSTFNDGVEVLGESMNPADITTTHVPNILYPQQRGLVELTNIDRGEKLWVDPYGYIWQGDQSKMVLLSTIPPRQQDNDPKSVWSGYNDRINSNFVMLKQEQIVKAQEIFDTLYMDIQGDNITDNVAETTNFTYKNRIDDSVLQQALIDEANRAQLVLEELLSKTHLANIHY